MTNWIPRLRIVAAIAPLLTLVAAQGRAGRDRRAPWWSARLRSTASSRLAQFALIGGAMFVLAPATERRDVLTIDSRSVAALAEADASAIAPSHPWAGARTRDVERRTIEDEVLYREGVRLGFDKDDGIIRQRVVQKMLFLAEELGGASRTPTESELRDFHRTHAERFQIPGRVRFRHVFARDPSALPASPGAVWPNGGGVSPVGPEMEATLADVEEALGAAFVAALSTLPVGGWSAPVRSAYGWHVVTVLRRTAPRPSTFEEATADVLEQFTVSRRQDAIASYLASTFTKYRLEIDGKSAPMPEPSRRLAMRAAASAED